jgi:hypothetical protein
VKTVTASPAAAASEPPSGEKPTDMTADSNANEVPVDVQRTQNRLELFQVENEYLAARNTDCQQPTGGGERRICLAAATSSDQKPIFGGRLPTWEVPL